jgi:hypothetical protein
MRFSAWILFVLVACSSEQAATSAPGPAPAGTVDPGADPSPVTPEDGDGATDGGTTSPPKDSGPTADANVTPADILGTMTGSCGHVKLYLTTTSSSLIQNGIEFVAGETYDKASLSDDGDRLFDTPNAGGSSTESETMSFEILRACDGAKLLKTETEITYSPPDSSGPNSISDMLVEIGGKKIGVQVTRVYRPPGQTLTDEDAKTTLVKKLEGINRSTVRVLPADKWVKQILHVFTANKAGTDAVLRVLPTLDASLKADTIVVLTQSKGGGFLYCNPDPALGSECP